jgi:hypothetical protein
MKLENLKYNIIYIIDNIEYEYNGFRNNENLKNITFEFFNDNGILNVPLNKLNLVSEKK